MRSSAPLRASLRRAAAGNADAALQFALSRTRRVAGPADASPGVTPPRSSAKTSRRAPLPRARPALPCPAPPKKQSSPCLVSKPPPPFCQRMCTRRVTREETRSGLVYPPFFFLPSLFCLFQLPKFNSVGVSLRACTCWSLEIVSWQAEARKPSPVIQPPSVLVIFFSAALPWCCRCIDRPVYPWLLHLSWARPAASLGVKWASPSGRTRASVIRTKGPSPTAFGNQITATLSSYGGLGGSRRSQQSPVPLLNMAAQCTVRILSAHYLRADCRSSSSLMA